MDNKKIRIIVIIEIIAIIVAWAFIIWIKANDGAVINDSLNQMNTQEIEAFNRQFAGYDGKQDITKVRKLLDVLVRNANDHNDYIDYYAIPEVKVILSEDEEYVKRPDPKPDVTIDEYLNELKRIRAILNKKKEFQIDFNYNQYGGLDTIIIKEQAEN